MSIKFDLQNVSGLTQIEVNKLIKTDGFNELPTLKKQNWFITFFRILSEPMLLLLVICGLIYLFIGEAQDALILLVGVFFIIGITYYQERKTEKTLEALKNLASPLALVIRDGIQKRIPGREVVRGDIVMINEGDRIPADAMVLSCENLSIDESLLTGENISVRKQVWDGVAEISRPGGDDLPFVYSGSLVVSGRGVIKIFSIGIKTEIGKIGKSLETIKDEETLLHKQTAIIVRTVAIIGLFLSSIVVLFYTFFRGSFIHGLLAGLSLSMAILPEEFPIVLLIFLTMGAWRISKRKVLTRKSSAIETLGAATVLCTDKTGTLTLNKMELTNLFANDSFFEIENNKSLNIPEKFHSLLEFGILASQNDPFDPIEKELNKIGNLYLKNTDHIHKGWDLIKEYPLTKELFALSHVWKSPHKNDYMIASKGAPESIVSLCHLSDTEKDKILNKVLEMSERGLRVIGAAKAVFSNDKLPDNQHKFDFEFIGLFGFVDPIRPTVPASVSEAHSAGIRVIIVTGDYAGTASFIALNIGIPNYKDIVTGEQITKMNHLELREKVKTVNIFARILPEQKLLIVNALKANGEIVAMTGDGVNDAPALKSAHIGIAMGERGTDVAREAASLVLLNDDFSSIVSAISLGRRIYENLKRAMGYIISVHIPIAGMSLLPLFFNFPIVLFPVHIAFLELIIDPSCSTVFESEKEDANIMKRPPRKMSDPLFTKWTLLINILQGFGLLVSIFIIYFYVIKTGHSEAEARSFAFSALVISNLMLIVVNLSWSKNVFQILGTVNKTFMVVITGALSCLFIALYVPYFSNILHMTSISIFELLLIFIMIVLSLLWFEVLKFQSYEKKFV